MFRIGAVRSFQEAVQFHHGKYRLYADLQRYWHCSGKCAVPYVFDNYLQLVCPIAPRDPAIMVWWNLAVAIDTKLRKDDKIVW